MLSISFAFHRRSVEAASYLRNQFNDCTSARFRRRPSFGPDPIFTKTMWLLPFALSKTVVRCNTIFELQPNKEAFSPLRFSLLVLVLVKSMIYFSSSQASHFIFVHQSLLCQRMLAEHMGTRANTSKHCTLVRYKSIKLCNN